MISPSVGLNARRIVRPAVVLPEPLSPTSSNVSPCKMCRLIPSTAFTVPPPRPRKPCLIGKYFLRFLTSSNTRRDSGILFLRLVQQAAYGVLFIHHCNLRHDHVAASRHHAAAARVKRASSRSLERARDRSFNRYQSLPGGLSKSRHCSQQIYRIRVLG